MRGILHIAYKLLVNDRAKYAALLVGITFAVFLMIEMTSLFAGILLRASATVINIGASIWVMDPAIQTVANTIPLPDYVLDEVRSIPGVKYAVPLYSGGALLKLRDGTYQAANVIGLDDTSLFGRPDAARAATIEDIYAENAFIAIKDSEFYKLGNPKIGTEFELNDHRGVHRRHCACRLERTVRRADALHDLQPRAAIHSQYPLHDFLSAGRAEDRRPMWRRSSSRWRRRDTSRSPKRSSSKRSPISTCTRPASAPTC